MEERKILLYVLHGSWDTQSMDDFVGFECGTHREEVWRWFDEHHTKGVVYLLHGEE